MALLNAATAAATAPVTDAEAGSSIKASTKSTRSTGKADDSTGGGVRSAFRWPRKGAESADLAMAPGLRGASVRAQTAVSVAIVPAAHFHAVCAAHPEVRHKFSVDPMTVCYANLS
jgi:hypothetical protein